MLLAIVLVGAACPLWVKSRHLQCKTACPLYPRKRTLDRSIGTQTQGARVELQLDFSELWVSDFDSRLCM